jgi:dihydroorotate dehydrogenase subfamily 1
VDLSVDLCGIPLPHPLILASGPLAWNAASIHAAYAAGAAAVVTKTIRLHPTENPTPHIATAGAGSLLNTEGWSDLPAAQWIERELPALVGRAGILIASTGHTPAEVAQLAAPLAHAGADLLELVSYRAEDTPPMVAAARRAVSLPVLVKVSANWQNIAQVVEACVAEGADGITAIDSIGPALRLDLEARRPRLGSFAWLSGRAILPLALRAVADVALRHDVPVVGTGGVATAEDVVEMVMAGADAVGVHSAPLLQGLGWFSRTLAHLERWLERHDVSSLAGLRGAALGALREPPGRAALEFQFRPELCTECGRCAAVCAYGARQLAPERQMRLNRELCRSCGLCVSVCSPGALAARSA